jgi:N-acetylglucosamine-6-phosphate deacetylase
MSPDSTQATTVIHSAQIVTGGSITLDGWIGFERGTVAVLGQGGTWEPAERATETTCSAHCRSKTPFEP